MPTPKNKYLTPRIVRHRISAARTAIKGVEARLKVLQDRIKDAIRRCPHQWQTVTDPVSGDPTHRECSICGLTL